MGNDDWKMMDDDDFQWFASIFMVMNKNLNGFSGVSSQKNSDVKDVWRDFGFFLILGLKQGLLSLEGISKRRIKQPPFSLRKVLLCALRAHGEEDCHGQYTPGKFSSPWGMGINPFMRL